MLATLPDSTTSKMCRVKIDNLVEEGELNNISGYRKYTKATTLNVTEKKSINM